MKAVLQASIIAAVSLLGALTVWLVKGPPERLTDDEVELSTVTGDWGGRVLWVDARKREEWRRNGVEGSVLINLDAAEDFDSMVAEALPRLAEAKRIVVYCGDSGCGTSREVSKLLCEYGLGVKGDRKNSDPEAHGPEIYVLHGGWDALAKAGMVPR
jgi:rhodanese-related sulfurtransferase